MGVLDPELEAVTDAPDAAGQNPCPAGHAPDKTADGIVAGQSL
jgi:hypothetical protein